jgi:aspartyl/asparaginyl beta-hydroxylase (cupin superfamily)
MKTGLLFLNAFLILGSSNGWLPSRTTGFASTRCAMVASSSRLPDTSTPLAHHTFAGLVEKGLLERFEEPAIKRVLQSWRLLDNDYFHREYVGEPGKEENSNMFQECHSYLPGLSIQPFWNPDDFGWTNSLKSKYKQIRKEFDAVNADMERLQQEGNNIWAGALTEDAAAYGDGWKTLVLMDRGRWDPENANLFPNTAKAVRDCGVPATEVFFACMKGPSKISPHTDFTNFVLTSHLALDIPYSGENKCNISVGDETHEWINGNVLLFDTSLVHDAVNDSDQMRYILMLRIWHPDLTDAEREALQFTYDCLQLPGLVSDDPGEKFMAEQTVEAMRAFPQLKQKSLGFGGKKSKGKKRKEAGGKSNGFGI